MKITILVYASLCDIQQNFAELSLTIPQIHGQLYHLYFPHFWDTSSSGGE